jgi:hypothetical protein
MTVVVSLVKLLMLSNGTLIAVNAVEWYPYLQKIHAST